MPLFKKYHKLKYYNHFKKLVEAISILDSKVGIKRDDIQYAQNLLNSFVYESEELYGMEAMTFNLHLLTHLPKYVLRFGPLWTHSCFPYERYNGIILNGCHGKSYYLEQIAQESRKLEFVSFLEKYFPNPQELKVLKILSKLKSAINYNYINKEEFQVYVNNDITIQYLGKPNLIFLKFKELKLLKNI